MLSVQRQSKFFNKMTLTFTHTIKHQANLYTFLYIVIPFFSILSLFYCIEAFNGKSVYGAFSVFYFFLKRKIQIYATDQFEENRHSNVRIKLRFLSFSIELFPLQTKKSTANKW